MPCIRCIRVSRQQRRHPRDLYRIDWKQATIEMALRKAIKDTLDDLKVEISYPKIQIMQ